MFQRLVDNSELDIIRNSGTDAGMFELWVPVTIAAAFLQNIRSSVQKHLTGQLSAQGAAYARFVYALPWAVMLFVLLQFSDVQTGVQLQSTFWLYCFAGAILQILSTVFLLHSFSYRSFAIGTTLSKLEIVSVAIVGVLLLGDYLSGTGILAIILCTLGVMLLAIGKNQWSRQSLADGLRSRATLFGLASAVALGAAVVFFRGASLSLQAESTIAASAYTLVTSLLIQTLCFGAYLVVRESGELLRVMKAWRWGSIAGIAGMLATLCWFYAFTIQNASYVRALGQTELLFTAFSTTVIFKESISRTEVLGCVAIVVGIVLLLLSG